MFETFNSLGEQARTLVITLAGVVWLAATVFVGVRRQSLLAAAGWFIGGAFLMWGLVNSDWFRDRAGDDIQGNGAPAPAVVVIDPVEG